LAKEGVEEIGDEVLEKLGEITEGMFDYSTNRPEGEGRNAAQQTAVKAGLVKWTSEYHYIPPVMQKAAEAAAIAHHQTGVPILTHTEMGTCALEQIELMETHGVKPSAMIICHTNRNPDKYLHREIGATGVYLSYDAVGRTQQWTDALIIDLIIEMFGAGFGNQIMVAMDSASRTMWRHYGYGPGLDYLLKKFIPRLKLAGFSERGCQRLLVENPAEALTFHQV
jgi:phosphotriesterase-related protein